MIKRRFRAHVPDEVMDHVAVKCHGVSAVVRRCTRGFGTTVKDRLHAALLSARIANQVCAVALWQGCLWSAKFVPNDL